MVVVGRIERCALFSQAHRQAGAGGVAYVPWLCDGGGPSHALPLSPFPHPHQLLPHPHPHPTPSPSSTTFMPCIACHTCGVWLVQVGSALRSTTYHPTSCTPCRWPYLLLPHLPPALPARRLCQRAARAAAHTKPFLSVDKYGLGNLAGFNSDN